MKKKHFIVHVVRLTTLLSMPQAYLLILIPTFQIIPYSIHIYLEHLPLQFTALSPYAIFYHTHFSPKHQNDAG
jgi:hypothetical protein